MLFSSDVEFVGYSIPHPSDPIMNLRIQTKGNYHLSFLFFLIIKLLNIQY